MSKYEVQAICERDTDLIELLRKVTDFVYYIGIGKLIDHLVITRNIGLDGDDEYEATLYLMVYYGPYYDYDKGRNKP